MGREECEAVICAGFLRHLWATYDHTVLLLISLNALNNGALSMLLMIVVNMYQSTFDLSPTAA